MRPRLCELQPEQSHLVGQLGRPRRESSVLVTGIAERIARVLRERAVRRGPISPSREAKSSADAGPVLQYSSPQRLCERRVADDVLELDLLGIEQLQPEVVVA